MLVPIGTAGSARVTRGLDLSMYVRALPLFARNLGVLLPPLIVALLAVGLNYFGGWFFAASGGAGVPLVGFLEMVLYGFAFGVSVIFADDAWRHGRAHLAAAWENARRKAGNIFIAVIGFLFVVWIARLIGGMVLGNVASLALGALAVWAFIYTIPAAAIGGTPGSAALSASLQGAKREPAATAILVIVSLVVWVGVTVYGADALPFYGIGYDIAAALLKAIALGYIALVVARQYSDLAFRPYW